MALKSTIFKAQLQIADMDRHHYQDHGLTLARHPSETDERMMMRLLAFGLNAEEGLSFGRGLSDDDEPDLWQKNLVGEILQWIEVGLPDERRLLKACSRSEEVKVYCYGSTVDVWWKQLAPKIARLDKLSVLRIPAEASLGMAALAQRGMQLQLTVQEGQLWLGNGDQVVQFELETLQQAERV